MEKPQTVFNIHSTPCKSQLWRRNRVSINHLSEDWELFLFLGGVFIECGLAWSKDTPCVGCRRVAAMMTGELSPFDMCVR